MQEDSLEEMSPELGMDYGKTQPEESTGKIRNYEFCGLSLQRMNVTALTPTAPTICSFHSSFKMA